MATTPRLEPVPLREDAAGALRVGETRVLLELVVHAFQDGATPEEIVQDYATLQLPDVHAVIAYCLRHPDEIEDYLRRREAQAEAVEAKIAAGQGDLADIRKRLLAQAPGRERI